MGLFLLERMQDLIPYCLQMFLCIWKELTQSLLVLALQCHKIEELLKVEG
jgi:hypothetical protein